MSVRVSAAVWDGSLHSGSDLIVMLALADIAKDNGLAWPGKRYLAGKTRISTRQVIRICQRLVDSGELQLEREGGGNRANLYRVNVPQLVQQAATRDPADTADAADIGDIGRWGVTVSDLNRPPVSGVPVTPDGTGTVSQPSENRQEEPLAAGAAEDQLFEAPPTTAAKPADALDPLIQRVWAFYVTVFGDRLRVKELTPPRAKSIRGGLKAMGAETDPENAVTLCCRAISGLKSYRAEHPDGNQDVNVSVIFETGPHTKHNRTDWISRWADYAKETLPTADAPVRVPIDLVGVPSVSKGTIQARRREVGRMYDHPESPEAKERGEAAVDWLKEHVGHQPKIVDGELRGWELIP